MLAPVPSIMGLPTIGTLVAFFPLEVIWFYDPRFYKVLLPVGGIVAAVVIIWSMSIWVAITTIQITTAYFSLILVLSNIDFHSRHSRLVPGFFILELVQLLLFFCARLLREMVLYCCCSYVKVFELEFLESLHNMVMLHGISRASKRSFLDFITNKLGSPGREQEKALLAIFANLSLLSEEQRSKSAFAKREVFHQLFHLIKYSPWLEVKMTAIEVLRMLTDQDQGRREVALAAASTDEQPVPLLIKAFHPETKKSVLRLLKNFSKLNEPNVLDIDEKIQIWQTSSCIADPQIWQNSAQLLMLQLILQASEYLSRALSSQAADEQELAMDILINLCIYGDFPHHQPRMVEMTRELFVLFDTGDNQIGTKASNLLKLLASEQSYRLLFMELNAESEGNAIVENLINVIMEAGRGKHALSILNSLYASGTRFHPDQRVDARCSLILLHLEHHQDREWQLAAVELGGTLMILGTENQIYNSQIRRHREHLLASLIRLISQLQDNEQDNHARGLIIRLCRALQDRDPYFEGLNNVVNDVVPAHLGD